MTQKNNQARKFTAPVEFDATVRFMAGIYEHPIIVSDTSPVFLTDQDAGKLIILDSQDGGFIALPQTTGSGNKFFFVVKTPADYLLATALSQQNFIGSFLIASETAARRFTAPAATTAIDLDGNTQGAAAPGDWLQIVDVENGENDDYLVSGFLTANDTIASPFV